MSDGEGNNSVYGGTGGGPHGGTGGHNGNNIPAQSGGVGGGGGGGGSGWASYPANGGAGGVFGGGGGGTAAGSYQGASGGNGGDFGGGGGSTGYGDARAGSGGYGGGGGAGSSLWSPSYGSVIGGYGGFGGGGGGSSFSGWGVAGGAYGGNGGTYIPKLPSSVIIGSAAGGGGGGLGGAVFVRSGYGGSLQFIDSTETSSTATGGLAGTSLAPRTNTTLIEATNGQSAGAAIFLGTGSTVFQGGSVAGSIAGDGATLVKTTSSTLTLSGSNAYSGGTIISAGTLQLEADGTTGSIAGEIVNNGQLIYNRTGTVIQSGAISGTGSIVYLSPGTLIFSGSNTYTGVTSLSAGVLQLASSNALGTSQIVLGGGTLQFTADNTNDYSGKFVTDASAQYRFDTNGQNVTFATELASVGGSLVKLGTGTLSLAADRSRRWLWFYGVSLFLLVLTKENAAFVFFAVLGLLLVNRWLHFGRVTLPLLMVTMFAPVAGALGLALCAGGFITLYQVFDLNVRMNYDLPYAFLNQDGPWFRYLIDLFLMSPLLMVFAIGGAFLIKRDNKPALFLLGFLVFSYLVMGNLRYGINLRFANMWDFPLRWLALVPIFIWKDHFSTQTKRSVFVAVMVAILFLFELSAYLQIFVDHEVYDPISGNLMRALDMIKSH